MIELEIDEKIYDTMSHIVNEQAAHTYDYIEYYSRN